MTSRLCPVQPAPLDHRHRLGERGNLRAGEKIIDQLEQRPASDRPNMENHFAHRRQRRARFLQCSRRAADQKIQFTRRSLHFAAGHGRVEKLALFRRGRRRQFTHPIDRDGAAFDADRSRRDTRQRPGFTGP